MGFLGAILGTARLYLRAGTWRAGNDASPSAEGKTPAARGASPGAEGDSFPKWGAPRAEKHPSFFISDVSFAVFQASAAVFQPSDLVSDASKMVLEASFPISQASEIISEASEMVSEPSFPISDASVFISEPSETVSEASEIVSEASFFISHAWEMVSETSEMAKNASFLERGGPFFAKNTLFSPKRHGFGRKWLFFDILRRLAGATASWSAAVLCRFATAGLATKSGRGLPHSKTWRIFPKSSPKPISLNRYLPDHENRHL